MYFSQVYHSPIGKLFLVADEENLIGLWIEKQKYFYPLNEDTQKKAGHPVLQKTVQWLDDYFAGKQPDLHLLPLKPKGSEFQLQVWEILKQIPYGTTITYGEIAREIAAGKGTKTMSAQAVGGAVGRNPIGIIIPCHRVIGSDGSLTGYAGGLDRKRWLLMHEGLLQKEK